MELLSYREAAKIADRSATAVHKAVHAGKLPVHESDGKTGLLESDVRTWSRVRWTSKEVAMASEFIHEVWTLSAVKITAFILQQPQKETWGTIAGIRIFELIAQLISHKNNDLRYGYSEGVVFKKDGFEDAAIRHAGPKYEKLLRDDLETRYLFAVYSFLGFRFDGFENAIFEATGHRMNIRRFDSFEQFLQILKDQGIYPPQ